MVVLLPRDPPAEQAAQLSHKLAAARPITLTVTQRQVVGACRENGDTLAMGCVPGRPFADNVYEAEPAMLSLSPIRTRSAAAVFFDFNKPSLALSRRWTMASLRRLGVPPGLPRIVEQLHVDCKS